MTISEQTGHKKQKTFFEEVDFVGSDKLMILNKPKLLETIEAACNQASLATLREKIFALREHLSTFKADKEGLLNIGTNGDTIQINQKYLFGELKQIVETQTLDRSKYYLRRLAKAIVEQKTNKLNDLNLNRWKEYEDIITDSLWVLNKRDNSGVHKADYWGNFIPQIPNQMMKRYTKKGEWVLDTFAGCGTTLIEAQRLGRNSLGIEIQPKVVDVANNLVKSEPNIFGTTNEVICGDSREIDYKEVLTRYGQKSVQLLIMHPPYFDIIKFSNDPRDLSNANSVNDFLEMMNDIVRKASVVYNTPQKLGAKLR